MSKNCILGQCFLEVGECPATGGLAVGPPVLFPCLFDEGGEVAATKKVVKDGVVRHGGYALSPVSVTNTSISGLATGSACRFSPKGGQKQVREERDNPEPTRSK
jgi:hypothetical protein